VTTIAIPEKSEELAELLTDDKRRGEIFADAEATKDFLAKYVRATNRAGDVAKQVADEVQKGIVAFLKDNGVQRPDLTPRPLAGKGAAYSRHAIGAVLDKEFDSMADFLTSTWHRNADGADKWRRIRNDYSSVDPSAGGFLIPEVLRAEVLRVSLESAIVRSRARVIPMDSLRVPFPMIDSTSNASSVYGGIVASWTEEGAEISENEAKFGRILLEAKKLACRCDVPNELLQDSIVSFAAFIDSILPDAIAWFEDDAFINGSGVGEPQGFLNSPALVSVSRATVDLVAWADIVGLYSRMLPASLGRAVFVASHDVFPQLATMTLGTGTAGIWINNGAVGPPMTILGRPVIFTEKMPKLTDPSAMAFVDFGYYLLGDRQQMRAESSPHAQFVNDKTVYRIIERVDGRGWVQSPITPKNGSATTLSPFVALAT